MREPSSCPSDLIEQAARLIRGARKGVALTGAGISTPSGIPDFRSSDNSLWKHHASLEVASLSAFRRNPERVFAWLRPLVAQITLAQPNPAHYALTALENAHHFETVITQNIDCLHQRAGFQKVLEVHGTLAHLTCTHCFRRYEAEKFLAPFIDDGIIPLCLECKQILKPDVIFFEEELPLRTWQQAEQAMRETDLLLVAGSSLVVMPVAGLPMRALENGARLIMVNKTPTYLDVRADVVLPGDVADILPRLAHAVEVGDD